MRTIVGDTNKKVENANLEMTPKIFISFRGFKEYDQERAVVVVPPGVPEL